MTGNDDYLFRILAAFDVTDDVVTLDIRQLLRREDQFHFHRSLPDKIGDQICIFRRDCTGWNFRCIICVVGLASMWKPIIGAADRTDQARNSTLSRRRAWTIAPINNCFAVCFSTTAFRGHLFVEGIIEKYDLARDFVARKRFQFVKISDRDHFGDDSVRRRRDACPERTKHNLLGRVLRLSRKLNERRCFFPAHPMRHHYFLELHFTADGLQFVRDVINRFGRLCRSAQARPDVVREMRNLLVCVIATQRRLLQSF